VAHHDNAVAKAVGAGGDGELTVTEAGTWRFTMMTISSSCSPDMAWWEMKVMSAWIFGQRSEANPYEAKGLHQH